MLFTITVRDVFMEKKVILSPNRTVKHSKPSQPQEHLINTST